MIGILNDTEITRLCVDLCPVCDGGPVNDSTCSCELRFKPMISPFLKEQIRWLGDESCLACTDSSENTDYDHIPSCSRHKAISFGVSSYGYDLRVADTFDVFSNLHGSIVDPKFMDLKMMTRMKAETVRHPHDGSILGRAIQIPPNSFALAYSMETFSIPEDVMTICVGKSTYARCGINVNVTPFEPAWRGQATLEISNTTPCPARIYAGEGLAQVLFFRGERPRVTYSDRGGRYQDQRGIVPPRV